MSVHKIDWENVRPEVFLNTKILQKEEYLNVLKPYLNKDSLYLLTSGTTTVEKWKWVVLKKSAILQAAESFNHYFSIPDQSKWCLALPFFHIAGIAIFARAYVSQGTVYEMSPWNPLEFCNFLRQYDCSLCSLVPTQLYDLVQNHQKSPLRLKYLFVGGQSLQEDLKQNAISLGWPVVETYGMTETCSTVGVRFAHQDMFDLLPHFKMKINSHQYLCLHSKVLFEGYIQDVFYDPKTKDGWYATEDIVSIENKQFHLLGRASELLKIYGEKVSIPSLKTKLVQIGMREFEVIALPNDRIGYDLIICFILKHNPSWKQIIQKFQASVLPFERLKGCFFVEQFSYSALGKIHKAILEKYVSENLASVQWF